MTHATFVDNDSSAGNRVDAEFLNAVNTAVYVALGAAGVAPTTTTETIDNLASAIAAKVFTALTATTVTGTTVTAGALTATSDSSFTSTGAVQFPTGTTAQRPTAVDGKVRYNVTLSRFEGYTNSAWSQLGGGATGAGSDEVFVENAAIVTTDYTLSTAKNAMSVGPITVNSGVAVTVPSGYSWVVLP